MSEEKRITRRDMEAAGARVAAANGQTVDELRAELAKIQDRECAGCGKTFAAKRTDRTFCSTACRARSHRANGSGGVS